MSHRDLPIRLHHEPSQRKLGHEPTAKFGKFLMLPRELQLLIWEWFEVVNLRVRHTFISIHPENFEYFDLSQTSFAKHVWSANRNFEDHETYPGLDARRPRSLVGFIDSAVARRYEVPLLRDLKWEPEYYHSLSRFDRPYDNFRRYAPTWMNFKVDSFFFLPALHIEDAYDDDGNGYNRRVFHELKHDNQGLSDDLSAVLAQWNTPPHNICECGQPRTFLRELLELRDDVCNLVKDRGVLVQIVAAGCDDPATIPDFKSWTVMMD
ncbi:hypothetical protein E8E14_007027 [Neopestalotiopsis sp. 37M]|nr:hypothetical protein E8E14_007027 [Neopestalotiopsis sp. 37M]